MNSGFLETDVEYRYARNTVSIYYFSIYVFVLIVLLSLWNAIPHAHAGVDRIYARTDELKGVFAGYAFPPPEKFLRPERLKKYRAHMAIGECIYAAQELVHGVRERYPDAPNPSRDVDGVVAFEHIVLPRFYPDVALCQAIEEVRKTQTKIIDKMLPAPRLREKRDIEEALDMSEPEQLRNQAVANLINLALIHYAPGQLALARIAESGEIVRLTPEFTYYILAHARAKGLSDKELDRLLGHASATLTPRTRKALRPMIAAGKWPRWAPIVRD